MTRQKLEHFFRTEGEGLIKSWAEGFYQPRKTKARNKVDMIKIRNGQVVKVGQIKIIGVTPRKEQK